MANELDEGITPAYGWKSIDPSGFVRDTATWMQDFALDRLSDISETVRDLDGYTAGWAAVEVEPYDAQDVVALPDPDVPPDPANIEVDFGSIAPVYVPQTLAIYTPQVGAAPTFDGASPEVDYGAAPNAMATFSGQAPTIADLSVPSAPTLDIPDPPDASNLPAISYEQVVIPTFDATLPEFIAFAPETSINFTEGTYSSAVLTALQDKILSALSGANRIGFPPGVWEEIEAKALAKSDAEESRLVEQASAEWHNKGWTLPGGAQVRMVQAARLQANTVRTAVLRELLIERAKHEVEQLKFWTTQGIALETVLINLFNSQMDRALKAAETAVRLAIDLFNVQVAVYNAQLAAYTAEAQVHRELIQAQLLKLEEAKIDIEVNKLTVEQDRLAVQTYVAQVDAATKEVQAYEAQVRGVTAQAEVMRAKAAIYAEEVRAYAEEVNAKRGEWDGYRARIEGEQAKVALFRAETEAHVATVQAYTAGVQAEQAKVEADGKRAQIEIGRLEADSRRFAAQADALAREAMAKAEVAKLPFLGYTAETEMYRAKAAAIQSQYNAAIEQAKAVASTNVAAAQLEAQQIQAMRELGFKALEGQKTISAQLAAAALQGINLSIGQSSSVGFNETWNGSAGVNWNYQYTAQAEPA